MHYTIIQASRKFGITEGLLRKAINAGQIATKIIPKTELAEVKRGMPLYLEAIAYDEMLKIKSGTQK